MTYQCYCGHYLDEHGDDRDSITCQVYGCRCIVYEDDPYAYEGEDDPDA